MKKKWIQDAIKLGVKTKIWKIMRLSAFFLFLFISQVWADSGYAQQTKLTMKMDNARVIDVLDEIENNSEFYFLFNQKLIDVNRKVNIYANEKSIDNILSDVFAETDVHHLVKNRLIILTTEKQGINDESIVVQQFKVSGRVTDNSGQTLPGVTVVISGTMQGTVTNSDGEYSLEGISPNATLQFSFVGMKTQEIKVEGKNTINVEMELDEIGIEEIVAIGYGTSRKKDLTGSISSIKLEDSPLSTLPNVNLLDALKGSMPGFDIGVVTGAGSNPSINIRGQNSIRASNDPLIVLDGVVFLGSLNEINPLDISSVDVLKDASSTAIYGSLAANGVLLITTKRGKTDKPTIQMNITGGIQTYTNRPDMLSPDGYIQLRKDRFQADDPTGTYDINTNLALYELDAYNANHTVDWFDEVTRPAPFQNYALSVSGSSNRSNYYVSGNYLDQKGIAVGDQFQKFSVLGKIESQITDWLKIGVNLSVTSKNADGAVADFRLATIDSPYGYKYVHDRGTIAPGFENFTDRLEHYPQGQTTTMSPLWVTQQYNYDRNQNYRGLTFARIDAPWVRGLSYTFNYSLNRWEGHYAGFQDENYFVNTLILNELIDPSLHLNEANGSKTNNGRTDWYMNHLINFKHNWGNHAFDATLLAERQGYQNSGMNIRSKDFSSVGTSILGVNALELGNSANYSVDTYLNELYQMAYLARLNYVYKSKYHISGSIRRDGYSGYAEGHKYGIFRAGAIAWTASEESFVKDNLSFIDNLKLRLSLGENGNPSVGAYATFPTIRSTDILIGGVSDRATYPSNLANKSLDWEKTTAFNFGVDFSIFKNVLSGSFDIYNSNTTNLLLSRTIPIFNGFENVLDNIGKINNKGLEIQLMSKNLKTNDFQWSSGVTFWLNRNKIVTLYGLDSDNDGMEDDDISNSLFIGKSLGAIYTYVMDGIIQIDDVQHMAIYGGQPGDIKFKDLNNDGKIDATNDRKIVGYTKPNFTMTLSNTFTYKNFELYFLFNYIAGGGKDNYYMGGNLYAYYPNALYGGTAANWLDKKYWTPDHPSNEVTRLNYNNAAFGYNFPKTREFLRLQDLSFSYYLPNQLLERTPISAMKVFTSGKNLLTFTKWEGLDPEAGTQYAGGPPVFKIITLGLNVTF